MDFLNKNKTDLGNFPTRILNYPRLSKKFGIELYIKREDEADSIGSGNKVRKLEYIINDAMEKEIDSLILSGDIQSNCGLSLSHYSPCFDIETNLVLSGEPKLQGNHLQMVLSGANITYVKEWSLEEVYEETKRVKAERMKKNKNPKILPTGATNHVSILAGIDMAKEIYEQQKEIGEFDDIVLPVGTGGTLYGIEIGKRMLGTNWTIYGVSIANSKTYFQKKFESVGRRFCKKHKVKTKILEDSLNIYDGALNGGYKSFTPKDVKEIIKYRREHGLILDTTYTHKAIKGMKDLVNSKKIKEKSRVLFIHTGGTNEVFSPPYKIAEEK